MPSSYADLFSPLPRRPSALDSPIRFGSQFDPALQAPPEVQVPPPSPPRDEGSLRRQQLRAELERLLMEPEPEIPTPTYSFNEKLGIAFNPRLRETLERAKLEPHVRRLQAHRHRVAALQTILGLYAPERPIEVGEHARLVDPSGRVLLPAEPEEVKPPHPARPIPMQPGQPYLEPDTGKFGHAPGTWRNPAAARANESALNRHRALVKQAGEKALAAQNRQRAAQAAIDAILSPYDGNEDDLRAADPASAITLARARAIVKSSGDEATFWANRVRESADQLKTAGLSSTQGAPPTPLPSAPPNEFWAEWDRRYDELTNEGLPEEEVYRRLLGEGLVPPSPANQ